MNAARITRQTVLRLGGQPRPVFHDATWYRGRAEYFASHAESARATGHIDVAATLERWSIDFRTLAERLRGVRP